MFDLENFKYKDLFYECFDIHNADFEKLIKLYNAEQEEAEKHHIIPKSYFKLKGIKLINKGNLISLSIKNHFKAHYYMWKICKIPKLKHKLALAYVLIKDVNPEMLDIKAEEYENIRRQALLNLEKKVVCLSTCEIYNSITKTGDRRGVSNIINGNQTTSRGLFWEEYNPEINYTKEYCSNRIEEIKKQAAEKIYRGKHKNDKKYVCLDTGKIYNDVGEVNKEFGNINLSNSLKRGRKIIAGKCWEEYNPKINYTEEYCFNRIEEIKKQMTKNYVCIKCIETGEVFSSIREAARVMKLDSSTITKILKGKRKSIYGYHFIKEEKIC